MVAVQDPITQEIESEPDKIENILHAFFSKSLHALNPKTSQYLPEQTPRHFPWDDNYKANRGTPDPFTLESKITRSEKEGSSERQWLHSSKIDQAAFHECISSLKNNKSPGPDGVVNKVLKMLPSEIQRVIHMLLIIMWSDPPGLENAKLCSLIKIKEKRHK